MDGSLGWLIRHHQSGTMMPSGAVHPIIAGLDPRLSGWIFVDVVHGVDSSAF
jgi:hypothetical protein